MFKVPIRKTTRESKVCSNLITKVEWRRSLEPLLGLSYELLTKKNISNDSVIHFIHTLAYRNVIET